MQACHLQDSWTSKPELEWSVVQIVQTLEHAGVLENAIVGFTSDNDPWTKHVFYFRQATAYGSGDYKKHFLRERNRAYEQANVAIENLKRL
ncbi:MAG: hypothetical protein O3C43_13455 [Verrucomicrobia bacterium]|nr:hypothetical protein [Verrucomicrobiota bacterium]MDA1067499.1 hypothetical protein [Verrucomicrobiota bacterium]